MRSLYITDDVNACTIGHVHPQNYWHDYIKFVIGMQNLRLSRRWSLLGCDAA